MCHSTFQTYCFYSSIFAKRNKQSNISSLSVFHVFSIIGMIIIEYTDKIAFIIITYYFYAIFLALFFHMRNQKNIKENAIYIDYTSSQVVLYSTGLLKYSLDITPGYDIEEFIEFLQLVLLLEQQVNFIKLFNFLSIWQGFRIFHINYSNCSNISTHLKRCHCSSCYYLLYFWTDIRRSLRKFIRTAILLGAIITVCII